jgi:hypothetical protein
VTQGANQLDRWAGLAVFAGYFVVTRAGSGWSLKTCDT